MKQLLATALLLACSVAHAANPSFGDFNATQFTTNGNKVAVKSGAPITNAYLANTFTANYAEFTNNVQIDGQLDVLGSANLQGKALSTDSVNGTNIAPRFNLLDSATVTFAVSGSNVTATAVGGGDTTWSNIVTLVQSGTNLASPLDFALVQGGGAFKITLTNNLFIGTPSNVGNTVFRKAWLLAQQPSTGTCLVTFTNGTFAFPGGSAVLNNTNNGAVAIYEFISDVFTNGLVHGSLTPQSKLIP